MNDFELTAPDLYCTSEYWSTGGAQNRQVWQNEVQDEKLEYSREV